MPRPSALLRALAAALVLVAAAGPALQARAQTGPRPVIVVLKPGVADPGKAAKALGDRHGFAPSHVYRHALKGFAAAVPADKLGAVRNDNDARVLFVGPDREVQTTAQTLPTGVDRIDADQNPTTRIDGTDQGVDVDVAVLDTGSGPHPDLNVVGGVNCTPGPDRYADGNGHGTHVAGTIGALDNGIGVVGVAPGARIWSVRVFAGPGANPAAVKGALLKNRERYAMPDDPDGRNEGIVNVG